MNISLSEILSFDYKRYGYNSFSISAIVKSFIILPSPGIIFITIFRSVQFYRRRNRFLFYIFYLWYRRLKVKYGFDISYRTQIGKGFYIGHFGGIVIHGDAKIGDFCNISNDITIGVANRGENVGAPTIGSYVFIGPGARIFGKIHIGNNSAIGANSVVLKSFAPYSVIAGVPARQVSMKGSESYIHNLE